MFFKFLIAFTILTFAYMFINTNNLSNITTEKYVVVSEPICVKSQISSVRCRVKIQGNHKTFFTNINNLVMKGEHLSQTCGTTYFQHKHYCSSLR